MKKLTLALGAAAWLICSVAAAQKPADVRPVRDLKTVTEVTPTPQMWFYEQYMNQYQDPKAAVRRKAEFRSEQREQRIASMKWFGMSNSRPQASTDPYNGDYSPRWTSNNRWAPYQWSGVGPSYVVVPSESSR